MELLRNNGAWRELSVTSPAGAVHRVYAEVDKNQRQQKLEGLTRKARAIIKERQPSLGERLAAGQRDGKLYVDWKPLCRVVVDSPDSAHLEWHVAVARDAGIDSIEVNKAWAMAARIDDGVDWQQLG